MGSAAAVCGVKGRTYVCITLPIDEYIPDGRIHKYYWPPFIRA